MVLTSLIFSSFRLLFYAHLDSDNYCHDCYLHACQVPGNIEIFICLSDFFFFFFANNKIWQVFIIFYDYQILFVCFLILDLIHLDAKVRKEKVSVNMRNPQTRDWIKDPRRTLWLNWKKCFLNKEILRNWEIFRIGFIKLLKEIVNSENRFSKIYFLRTSPIGGFM